MKIFPADSPKDSLSNKLVDCFEWQKEAIKSGPALQLAQRLTLIVCTAPFATIDCLGHTALFTAKLMTKGVGTLVRVMTGGHYGKFSKEITFQELKDHAFKAGLFFLYATASIATTLALVIFANAVCAQFVVSVSLIMRISTVAMLLLTAGAIYWIQDPEKLIAGFRYHQMIAPPPSAWEKAQKFALKQYEWAKQIALTHYKTAAVAGIGAGAVGAAAVVGARTLPR